MYLVLLDGLPSAFHCTTTTGFVSSSSFCLLLAFASRSFIGGGVALVDSEPNRLRLGAACGMLTWQYINT